MWSRNLISYQVYFVAGVLVAYHFEAVCNIVRRWSRWVLAGRAVVGRGDDALVRRRHCPGCHDRVGVGHLRADRGGMVLRSDRRTLRIECAWWERGGGARADRGTCQPVPRPHRRAAGPRSRLGPGRLRLPSITYLAGLTGGFYLCHVLFINMIRAALYSSFVGGEHLPWPIRTAIFYVGTAVVAATFVSLMLRTPLRWVLGGPVRAEQRVRDNAEVARAGGGRRRGTARTRTARRVGGPAPSARLDLEGSGVPESLTDTLTGPGDEFLGLIQHEVRVDSMIP